MITGIVTPNLEAIVRLHIADGAGQTQAIDAKIDTGFSDFMSLPIATVTALALPVYGQEDVQIGDGTTVPVDVHSAIVIWDGKVRPIEVLAMGIEPLIGMRMLASHDLTIRVRDGGGVSIALVP